MRKYADDILIIFGLVLLGLAIWQAWGTVEATAYTGTVLIVLGIALGWQGRAAR